MSLHKFAEQVAANGRGDDSLLVHMTPDEVRNLQRFAKANGTTLTINPETGLPEAGLLSDLFKAVAPIALGAFLGPAGAAIGGGFMSAGMAGLTVGGLTTLATGSLSRGLMAGLGAYGGAGLGESLLNAGTGGLAATDIAAQQAAGGFPTLAEGATQEQIAKYATDVGAVRDAALSKAGEASLMSKASAGLGSIARNPAAYGSDLFKYGSAAAAPIMADMMVPTTTQMPAATDTGYIRQKVFDPGSQTYRSLTPVKASDFGSRNFSDIYRGYNGGGIVALAEGGAGADAINKAVEVNKYFKTNPDVAKAYEANTYGLTPQQFAQTHYERYGQTEQRAPVGIEALVPTTLKPVDTSATDVQGGIGFTPHVGNAGTTPPPVVAPAVVAPPPLRPTDAYQVAPSQSAAATQYLQDNPDVASWLTSEQGKAWTAQHPNFDAQDIAWTHYKKFGEKEQRTWGVPPTIVTPVTPVITTPQTNAPAGTTNPYGNATNPGDITRNPDGTITVQPNIPGRPYGGFSGMGEVKNAYTQGGGSLGYTPYAPKTAAEHEALYNKQTGDSLAAYNYLMGKGAYPTKSTVGEIARPYREATLGYAPSTNKAYNYDAATGRMVRNPDYVAPGRDAAGNVTYTMSLNEMKNYLTTNPLSGQALFDWAQENGASAQDIADATGRKLSEVYAEFRDAAKKAAAAKTATATETPAEIPSGATGGAVGYAVGGGLGSLGSYSDGGRLLKGPGDGVSDSIPATIGRKQQPARLADGEFVVPARIVSELGNGSTDAGAKKLYAMLDRVQRARGKTIGKNKVAANSRADKYLPA